jgi:methylase of polypeptide subunit release factors
VALVFEKLDPDIEEYLRETRSGPDILDLGSSSGSQVRTRQAWTRVVGTDISETALARRNRGSPP